MTPQQLINEMRRLRKLQTEKFNEEDIGEIKNFNIKTKIKDKRLATQSHLLNNLKRVD